jgi:heme exporter protein B
MTSPSLRVSLRSILLAEMQLAFRTKRQFFNALMFFVLVLVLFPLGVDPGKAFLAKSAAGLVWVACLLASMLAIESMYRQDFEDGTLEQWVVSGQPLFLIVLVKNLVQWLGTGLPLIILTPLLATMLHLPSDFIPLLMLSLLLGTPVVTLIGSIGAALTVSIRNGGVLLFLLVLPLTVPVLIFGTAVLNAAADGLPVNGMLAVLFLFFVLALSLCPFATSAALKMSVEQ